jgi:hypothetical protein
MPGLHCGRHLDDQVALREAIPGNLKERGSLLREKQSSIGSNKLKTDWFNPADCRLPITKHRECPFPGWRLIKARD